MNIVVSECEASNDLYKIVRCEAPSNQILSVIGKPLFSEDENNLVDLLKQGFRSPNYADLVRGLADAPDVKWSLVDYHGIRLTHIVSSPNTDEDTQSFALFLDYDEKDDKFCISLVDSESNEIEDISTIKKHIISIASAIDCTEKLLLTMFVDAGLIARTLHKNKVLKALLE